ncbi:uncharacterized protein LOC133779321 [Humulus lupulus]|uniref:uncharacterized protein LOC133779321 n=1 Tax=Humulus lupulus TaxID=3486 RepID=UPI002B410CF6|nr:uncharacterized protein LOC133779321 [Humulus lupulus]
MVDNYFVFDDYHWGRVSFDLTFKGLKKAPHRTSDGGNYPVDGCAIALQIFAFEIIGTTHIYANKIGDQIPRITNWSSTEQPTFENISTKVFQAPNVSLFQMIPTDEEMRKSYMVEFRDAEFNEEIQEEAGQSSKAEYNFDISELLKQNEKLLRQNENLLKQNEKILTQNDHLESEINDMKRIIYAIHKKFFEDNLEKNKGNTNVSSARRTTEAQTYDQEEPMEVYLVWVKDESPIMTSPSPLQQEPAEVQIEVEIEEQATTVEGKEQENIEQQVEIEEQSAAIVEQEHQQEQGNIETKFQILVFEEPKELGKRTIKPGIAQKSPYTTKFGSAEGESTRIKRAKPDTPTTPKHSQPSFDLGISPLEAPLLVSPLQAVQQLEEISPFQQVPLLVYPLQAVPPLKQASPFQQASTLEDEENIINHPFTDEIDKPPSLTLCKDFTKWLKEGFDERKGTYVEKEAIDPPFNFVEDVVKHKMWFYDIWSPIKCISDYHMDVVFYYLRKKLRHNNTRCTTMDAICDRYINKAWETYINNPSEQFSWEKKPYAYLLNCANGKKMRIPTPWINVDFIYSPVYIRDMYHWVLVEIVLKSKKIKIYDSMAGKGHKKNVMTAVTAYSMMIPMLLQSINFYKERKNIEEGDFDMEFVEDLEVQQNGTKSLRAEALMSNNSLKDITNQKMRFFREKLAVELYAWGKEKQRRNTDSDTEMVL